MPSSLRRSRPRVVLVGLPGAGKSTIGRRLAHALHCQFVDTDTLIGELHGLSCGEVFSHIGEAAFRRVEEEQVALALKSDGIVALGGGAVISATTRALLSEHTVVYLKISAAEGVRRTCADDTRPILAAEDPAQRYRQIQAERAPFYEEVANLTVTSEDRDPRQTVSEILHFIETLNDDIPAPTTSVRGTPVLVSSARSVPDTVSDSVTGLRRIRVATSQPYDVVIGRHLDDNLAEAVPGATKAVIFHQPLLTELAARLAESLRSAGIAPVLHEIPDAEAAKTVAGAAECWDICAAAGLSRQDAIIGVGGGATTDLAGFIAATWMRGIRVIHYPTTLLAMVDAAVGGKTGINIAAGKNLVGSFHEPAAVLVDLDVLDTLPEKEIIAGSAEIVKAGFIRDPRILDLYETDSAAALDPHGALPELIELSIQVKADVVSQDLRESSLREILNYGHTYGHAVEQHEKYRWRHGWAVAVGMVYEAELAHSAGLLSAEAVRRHRRILSSIGLPTSYAGASLDELLDVMGRDKKNRGGQVRIVVLSDLDGLPYRPVRLESPESHELHAAYDATQVEKVDV